MNWILSVLAGLVVAVLVLYFIKKNQAPVPVTETYVQQPVGKGAPIADEDAMLVAVGLQAIYTPRPSVMDSSEISKDAWLAAQAASTGGAAGPAAGPSAARVQQAEVGEPQAPVGVGSSTPMWSAGAVSGQSTGGGQPAQMQVFLPGGPSAAEQLIGPTPSSSTAATPRARTAAEIAAANAKAQEDAINQAAEYQAIRDEADAAAAKLAKIAALKATAEGVYNDTWLPARPSGQRKDTAANRTAYVSSLQAQLQLDTLNFNTYFDSNYKSLYGASSIGSKDYQDKKMAEQQILFDAEDTITALDSTWQNSNATDCYPVPWPAFASETACSKSCGPGMKVQTRKYVEPTNGGQACPATPETRSEPCNLRDCTYTTQPAQPVCIYPSAWNATAKKCVETSQLDPANGCDSGFTYNSSTGYCTKTGYTSARPTPPPGDFTFNPTTKKFEKTSDATFTCPVNYTGPTRGWTGLLDPYCEANI